MLVVNQAGEGGQSRTDVTTTPWGGALGLIVGGLFKEGVGGCWGWGEGRKGFVEHNVPQSTTTTTTTTTTDLLFLCSAGVRCWPG